LLQYCPPITDRLLPNMDISVLWRTNVPILGT